MNLEESFEKAAEGLAKAADPEVSGQPAPAPEAAQTKPAEQAPTTPEASAAPEAKAEDKDKREWDGKNESLVGELKQDPKAVQRAYTKKAMALAEAEKRLKEYEGLNTEEVNAYRQWKQQQEAQKQQQLLQQAVAPTQLTPEQFELIKSDPNAMNVYVNSLVQAELQKAAQVIIPEITQMKYEREVEHWKDTIDDFAAIHPDLWDMHESGLFKPILEETVKQGGTLDDAYAKAAKIRDAMLTKAQIEAQAGVRAKREAASLTGNSSGIDDTVYADNSKDAFDKAIDLAFSRKESAPTGKIITPKGKVRTRK